MVLLDKETPLASRKIYSEEAEGEARSREPALQTQCFRHEAIQLKTYCWEGVEFIQLVYYIIIYLSFLNCD